MVTLLSQILHRQALILCAIPPTQSLSRLLAPVFHCIETFRHVVEGKRKLSEESEFLIWSHFLEAAHVCVTFLSTLTQQDDCEDFVILYQDLQRVLAIRTQN